MKTIKPAKTVGMLPVVLAFVATTQLILANNIVWTNTVGGNWSATNNWSPNQAPGPADVAVITNDGNYTVTLDISPSVGGLLLGASGGSNTQIFLLNGQTFTLAGAAVVSSNGQFNLNSSVLVGSNAVFSGAVNCLGSKFSGTITVSSNGVLNLGAATATFDSYYGGIAVLTNYGTVNWNGGNINGNNNPRIENYGLWNAQSDNSFLGGQPNGATVFDNFGTFRKSGGTGTNAMDAYTTFNTSGTVDVETGTVAVQKGGGSGDVLNTAGGAVASLGSSFVFSGGTFFSGSGTISGFIIGSNAVFSGAANCLGNVFSGAITVSNNAMLNLGAATAAFDSYYGGIAVLTNYGTVNWNGGNINGNNSPRIENYGLWNAQSDNSFFGGQPYGITSFDNFGTFRKSGGTGTTTVDAYTVFNTSGTLDVETGTVAVQKGGGSGDVLNTAGGAVASLGSSFVFSGGTFFSGSGTISGFIIGSNAVFSGAANCLGNVFSGAITVSNNAMLNLGAATAAFDSYYGGIAVLTNYGTVNWNGGNINGNNSPRIENYGLWNAQSDNSFFGGQPYGITSFDNFGTFRKSGGTGTTTVDAYTVFNTSGTLDVEAGTVAVQRGGGGGVLNTAGGAVASLGGSFVFNGGTFFSGSGTVNNLIIGSNAVFSGALNCLGTKLSGTITVSSNGVLNLGAATVTFDSFYAGIAVLTNYGTVNWNGGGINGDNSPRIENYGLWNAQTDNSFLGQQPSGTTIFDNFGTFRKSGGTGTTAVDAPTTFNTPGTVDVQTGTVSLLGSRTLSSGTLNFGINSSNNFGRISVSGNAVLGGTVRANLNNLYAPVASNSFAVLAYGTKSGTFSSYNLPAGLNWTNTYGATAFTLAVASVAPANLSGTISTQDGTNFTFSFGTVPGQIYQIQYTTNLAPANWMDLGAPVQATNTSLTISDAINQDPERFYRAVLQ